MSNRLMTPTRRRARHEPRDTMNRPLAITQRQVKAICEGAKKAGYAPVLEIGNVVIRLIPEALAIPPQVQGPIDPEEEIDL